MWSPYLWGRHSIYRCKNRIFIDNVKLKQSLLEFFVNFVALMADTHIIFSDSELLEDGVAIDLPSSKSISNRALLINALSGGKAKINNISDCDDTAVVLKALRGDSHTIDVGAAGTAMRFLTAYYAMTEGDWIITGSERMRHRPIGILVEALRECGADISYLEEEGYPPLVIKGKNLEGGRISVDGSVSSQYISALLMAAPLMRKGLRLELEGKVASVPYINMTLSIMSSFGIEADWKRNVIEIEPQKYVPVEYTVESDWSAASYWYEMIALSDEDSCVRLNGLRKDSLQGDCVIAEIFENFGVETRYGDGYVDVRHKESGVHHFVYDFSNCPDLAQTVVATCCLGDTRFNFSGLQSLKIKETDRIAALIAESAKLGYVLKETGEGELVWNGEMLPADDQIEIETYKDHRMAMSFAPAAMRLGGITIKDWGVVSKSYPDFWNDLKRIGFDWK